jgi:hypothetical protein
VTEVVRPSRLAAEDAEFGQEDAEELSGALTTYQRDLVRKPVGSDDERGARRVQRVGAAPRKSEVVWTSRLDAEDAEFGQEDAEELSGARTTYQRDLVRKPVGSDDERGARRVRRVGADPRKSEVVRTSRLDAEDAEFGQEDAEELSGALTTYPCQEIRTCLGPAERERAMAARRAASKVPASEAGWPTSSVRNNRV